MQTQTVSKRKTKRNSKAKVAKGKKVKVKKLAFTKANIAKVAKILQPGTLTRYVFDVRVKDINMTASRLASLVNKKFGGAITGKDPKHDRKNLQAENWRIGSQTGLKMPGFPKENSVAKGKGKAKAKVVAKKARKVAKPRKSAPRRRPAAPAPAPQVEVQAAA